MPREAAPPLGLPRPSAAATAAEPTLEVPDQIVAMLALPRDGGILGVLGRRTFSLISVAGAGPARLRSTVDLTPFARRDLEMPRRAVGYLEEAPEGFVAWSDSLAAGAGIRFAWDRSGLRPSLAGVGRHPWLDAAREEGWPGRTVVLSDRAGAPVALHADGEWMLVSRGADGAARQRLGPVGEPLLATPAAILCSSATVPGEPDRILEILWDGEQLRPGRRGIPVDGDLSAVAPLEGGRRLALALEVEPRRTRIVILPRDGMWEGPPP